MLLTTPNTASEPDRTPGPLATPPANTVTPVAAPPEETSSRPSLEIWVPLVAPPL